MLTAPELNGRRYVYAPENTVYFIDRGLRRPLTAAANARLFGNNSWLSDDINLGTIGMGELLGDASYLAQSADGPDRATVFFDGATRWRMATTANYGPRVRHLRL